MALSTGRVLPLAAAGHACPQPFPTLPLTPPPGLVQGFGITLVFPLCKMDLAQLLGRKKLPPAIAKAVLRQCFAAVAALHASGG